MKQFVAHCTIQNGKIAWKNDQYMEVNLPKYEGLKGILTIAVRQSVRSIRQNALYWEWVTIIGDTFGNAKEEMHTILKGLVGHKKEVKVGKKLYMIPRSTSSYSKGEMVEYMFNVKVWASQEGITLPSPEDYQLPQLK